MKYIVYLIRLCLYKFGIVPDRQACIGKHILIGITFLGENDRRVERFQTHGRIRDIDDHLGMVIDKADGSGTYTLPPWPLRLAPARPGQYRLRTTGEVVVDPDYLSNWTLKNTQQHSIAVYKAQGMGPFRSRE